jgi:hypothetical protein
MNETARQMEWLTAVEAASELFVQPATLANWRVQGKGPAYHKFGRAIVYLREDLEDWKREQRHEREEQKRSSRISLHVSRPDRVRVHRLGGYHTKSETRRGNGGSASAGDDRRPASEFAG